MSFNDVGRLLQQHRFGSVADRSRAYFDYSVGTRGCVAELIMESNVVAPSTPAQQAQLYVVLACLSRFNGDKLMANNFYNEAVNLVRKVYDEVDEDSATAALMIGYYHPITHPKAYVYSSIASVLCSKLPPSLRRTRIMKFANLVTAMGDHTKGSLLKPMEETNKHEETFYDVTLDVLIGVFAIITSKIGEPFTFDSFTQRKIQFSLEEKSEMLRLIQLGEDVTFSNLTRSSVAMLLLFKSVKVLIMWYGGDNEAAAAEARQCIQYFTHRSVDMQFSSDFSSLMVLYWCLKETSTEFDACNYLEVLIRRLCDTTEQFDLLKYFSTTSISPTSFSNISDYPSPSSSSTSSLDSFLPLSPTFLVPSLSPESVLSTSPVSSPPSPTQASPSPSSPFSSSSSSDNDIPTSSNIPSYLLFPTTKSNTTTPSSESPISPFSSLPINSDSRHLSLLQQQVQLLQNQIQTLNQQVSIRQATPPAPVPSVVQLPQLIQQIPQYNITAPPISSPQFSPPISQIPLVSSIQPDPFNQSLEQNIIPLSNLPDNLNNTEIPPSPFSSFLQSLQQEQDNQEASFNPILSSVNPQNFPQSPLPSTLEQLFSDL